MKKMNVWFCIITLALGQAEGDVINVFNGGNIGFTGIFKLQNLAPPGAFNLGTSSGFVSNSSELVFYNAAALANVYEPKFSIDVTPPSINVLDIVNDSFDGGFQGEIKKSLEGELESYKGDDSRPYNYPTFAYDQEPTISINSISFVLPINDFRIGLGFTQLADFGINFLLTGTSLQLDHEDSGNPLNELSFILQNEMVLDLSLNLSEQIFSMGYRVNDMFNVGFSLINTSISGKIVADIQLDGFIKKQGELISFNTVNNDNVTNYMNQRIDGHIKSHHTQFRFSTNIKAKDWLGFSFTFLSEKEEALDAGLKVDLNYPNFISGESGDGFANVDNNLLDAANATRTRNVTHEATDFKLFRSGKIAFITTMTTGNFKLVLEVDKFSGSDGITYKNYDEKKYTVDDFTKKYDTFERQELTNQVFLLEPKIGGKFGLKWGIFNLGAGFTAFDLIQTKEGLEEKSDLFYGHLLMGFSFNLLEELEMNLTVLSSSLPVGRMTFSYSL